MVFDLRTTLVRVQNNIKFKVVINLLISDTIINYLSIKFQVSVNIK